MPLVYFVSHVKLKLLDLGVPFLGFVKLHLIFETAPYSLKSSSNVLYRLLQTCENTVWFYKGRPNQTTSQKKKK